MSMPSDLSSRRRSALARCGIVLAIACGLLGSVALGPGRPAAAAAPTMQGWWMSAAPGSVGGVPSPPSPSPPDVPKNGLLAQGGPSSASGAKDSGASAYAALLYQVPAGSTVGALTLAVAPKSATTSNATLELCPLTTQNFQPEEGGPMSDAPSYSCAHNVTSTQQSGSYRFSVSSLISDGALAVAILPTSPASRVVLSQPGAQSLPVQSPGYSAIFGPVGTSDSSAGIAPVSSSGSGSPAPAAGALTGLPSATSPSAPGGTNPALAGIAGAPAGRVSAAAPALAEPSRSSPGASTSNGNGAQMASVSAGNGSRSWVGLVFLAALLAAAALWVRSGKLAARQEPQATASPEPASPGAN